MSYFFMKFFTKYPPITPNKNTSDAIQIMTPATIANLLSTMRREIIPRMLGLDKIVLDDEWVNLNAFDFDYNVHYFC